MSRISLLAASFWLEASGRPEEDPSQGGKTQNKSTKLVDPKSGVSELWCISASCRHSYHSPRSHNNTHRSITQTLAHLRPVLLSTGGAGHLSLALRALRHVGRIFLGHVLTSLGMRVCLQGNGNNLIVTGCLSVLILFGLLLGVFT